MNKIKLYVCENKYPEMEHCLKTSKYTDYELSVFQCVKNNPETKENLISKINKEHEANVDTVLVCSENFDGLLSDLDSNSYNRFIKEDHCISLFDCKAFFDYIIKDGGYAITSGWLENWEVRLSELGFTKELARKFYQEFAKVLILINYKGIPYSKYKLEALSNYLEIPYKVITVGTKSLEVFIDNLMLHWQLHKEIEGGENELYEHKRMISENAAIIDMMQKISKAEDKRGVIRILKELFLFIFGAQKFEYIDKVALDSMEHTSLIDFAKGSKNYSFDESSSSVNLLLKHSNELFGVIQISDFTYPQYISRYLEFMTSISEVSSLSLSNAMKIEDLKKTQSILEYNGSHDGLTGLYNRSYYNKVVDELKKTDDVGVFLFDLDKLKAVNDEQGHDMGDEYIKLAAKILTESFRAQDIITRIGGDEFVVIIKDCDIVKATILEERINKNIIKNNLENTLKISISFGYSVSNNHRSDFVELIKDADAKMYQHKRSKYFDIR